MDSNGLITEEHKKISSDPVQIQKQTNFSIELQNQMSLTREVKKQAEFHMQSESMEIVGQQEKLLKSMPSDSEAVRLTAMSNVIKSKTDRIAAIEGELTVLRAGERTRETSEKIEELERQKKGLYSELQYSVYSMNTQVNAQESLFQLKNADLSLRFNEVKDRLLYSYERFGGSVAYERVIVSLVNYMRARIEKRENPQDYMKAIDTLNANAVAYLGIHGGYTNSDKGLERRELMESLSSMLNQEGYFVQRMIQTGIGKIPKEETREIRQSFLQLRQVKSSVLQLEQTKLLQDTEDKLEENSVVESKEYAFSMEQYTQAVRRSGVSGNPGAYREREEQQEKAGKERSKVSKEERRMLKLQKARLVENEPFVLEAKAGETIIQKVLSEEDEEAVTELLTKALKGGPVTVTAEGRTIVVLGIHDGEIFYKTDGKILKINDTLTRGLRREYVISQLQNGNNKEGLDAVFRMASFLLQQRAEAHSQEPDYKEDISEAMSDAFEMYVSEEVVRLGERFSRVEADSVNDVFCAPVSSLLTANGLGKRTAGGLKLSWIMSQIK